MKPSAGTAAEPFKCYESTARPRAGFSMRSGQRLPNQRQTDASRHSRSSDSSLPRMGVRKLSRTTSATSSPKR